jgi:hypothetical protein
VSRVLPLNRAQAGTDVDKPLADATARCGLLDLQIDYGGEANGDAGYAIHLRSLENRQQVKECFDEIVGGA